MTPFIHDARKVSLFPHRFEIVRNGECGQEHPGNLWNDDLQVQPFHEGEKELEKLEKGVEGGPRKVDDVQPVVRPRGA